MDFENLPGCTSDSVKPSLTDTDHDLLAHMSQQKLCNPGYIPKCFTCTEEAVKIARKKLKKVTETLMKGHFL